LMQQTSSDWNGVNTKENLTNIGFDNFSIIIAKPTKQGESGTKGLLSSNFSFSFNRLKNFDRSLTIKNMDGGSESSMADYMGNLTANIPESNLTYRNDYDPYISTDIPWLSLLAYNGGLIAKTSNGSWVSKLNNPETVTPSYKLSEKGYVNEYSAGWAGNLSNFVYFGASANIQSINYSSYSQYSEIFGGGGGIDLIDTIKTSGNGLNFKFGAIVSPFKFLRLGFSFHTPTVFILKDHYYSKLNFETLSDTGSVSTPGGISDYQLKSPMQLNASVAYLLGEKAVISVEYDYSIITGSQLMSKTGDKQVFADQNQGIQDKLNDMQALKIGAEYNISDNFSVRAGFANSNNTIKPDVTKILASNSIRTDPEYFIHKSTNYITAGFGYQKENWFLDCAFQTSTYDEIFYSYSAEIGIGLGLKPTPANLTKTNNNLILTVGYRF
ncbi:MAG: outer membrane protein transport protein, partial [Paludibacter sp.]